MKTLIRHYRAAFWQKIGLEHLEITSRRAKRMPEPEILPRTPISGYFTCIYTCSTRFSCHNALEGRSNNFYINYCNH